MPKKSSSRSPVKTRSKSKSNKVVFSNGAEAVKGMNPKNPNLLTIIKGPTKGNKGPRGMKRLSPRAAAAAFNKFYTTTDRYKTPKSRKAAITRDLCHAKVDKTVETNKYASIKGRRTGPLTFDYPDLDDGSRCPTGSALGSNAGTPAMKRKMAKVRKAKFSPKRKTKALSGGAKKNLTPLEAASVRAEAEGKCYFNSETLRCAKGPFEGASNSKWCVEGDKGVCKKSPLGKRRAEKNPKLVKRGEEISKKPLKLKLNYDLTGRLEGATLCKDMSQKDCEGFSGRKLGCAYGKMGRPDADGNQVVGCHQKHILSHVGSKHTK